MARTVALSLSYLIHIVVAQPSGNNPMPGMGTDLIAGVESATGCSVPDDTVCGPMGENHYSDPSGLSYSAGKFTGTLKGNQCPFGAYYQPNNMDLTSTCSQVTFPVTGYETGPQASPLRGSVAYTLSLGNVYGPMEAGFGDGQPEACSTSGVATCQAGLDVPTCEAKIRYECQEGGGDVLARMLLDDCGGHAMPYHYHVPTRCEYSQHDSSVHSPLIAIALDGYGVYGVWEDDGEFPALDACNGHYGTVPANSTFGITSESVYHYHMTPYAPYTLGCFGPVESLDHCKCLYDDCGNGNVASFTARRADGTDYTVTNYDLDCPCAQHYTEYTAARLDTVMEAYQVLVTGFSYPPYTDPGLTAAHSVPSSASFTGCDAGTTMAAGGDNSPTSGSSRSMQLTVAVAALTALQMFCQRD